MPDRDMTSEIAHEIILTCRKTYTTREGQAKCIAEAAKAVTTPEDKAIKFIEDLGRDIGKTISGAGVGVGNLLRKELSRSYRQEFARRDITKIDSLGSFLSGNVIMGTDKNISKQDFYEAYVNWSRERKLVPKPKTVVGMEIQRYIPSIRADRNYYRGINLRGV